MNQGTFDPISLRLANGLSLLDTEGMRQLIKARLDSRQWWVIVAGPSQDRGRFTHRLESEHYAGTAGADFETLLVPNPRLGLITIFLARKLRCLPGEIETLITQCSGGPLTGQMDLTRQDVIIISDGPDAAKLLARWLVDFIEKGE
ncbi:MAG: hypothetical protein ACM359_00995 [Bacillota bacterium]